MAALRPQRARFFALSMPTRPADGDEVVAPAEDHARVHAHDNHDRDEDGVGRSEPERPALGCDAGRENEKRRVAEDVEFLFALRRLGRTRGQRLTRARRAKAIASLRKWDEHGE